MGQLFELHDRFRPHTVRPSLRCTTDVTVIASEISPLRRVLVRSFPDSPEFVAYISRELEKHHASVMVAELFIEALRRSVSDGFQPVRKHCVVRLSDPDREPHLTRSMILRGEEFSRELFGLSPVPEKKCIGAGSMPSLIPRSSVNADFVPAYIRLFYRALAMILVS